MAGSTENTPVTQSTRGAQGSNAQRSRGTASGTGKKAGTAGGRGKKTSGQVNAAAANEEIARLKGTSDTSGMRIPFHSRYKHVQPSLRRR